MLSGDDLVFVGQQGGPLRSDKLQRLVIRPAARRIRLPAEFRTYDLRHTCASLLIAAGAHPRAIMERLGHKDIKTTLNVYGHLFPELQGAVYGKWHVGEGPGRWPTDHGFEEWYGVRHTYDEALWSIDPWYDPERDGVPTMVEIRQGEHDVTEGEPLTYEHRRVVDVEYLRRAISFMGSKVAADQPFFLYFNHSMMHMPCVPRDEFDGRTGNGEWADSLLELDSDFGALLDEVDRLGIRDDTTVVFAGDNGPEDMLMWRGSPGFWRGSYFAGGEGNLRTPCIVRWPGNVPVDVASDDIVHVTDWFVTLLAMAGCVDKVPTDRNIDGVDQTSFMAGSSDHSAREGFLYWMADTLYGVKWRHLKLKLVEQTYMSDPVARLSTPHIVNLITDPHEREPYNHRYLHTWTATHFGRLLAQFRASVAREPLIPTGAPLQHTPSRANPR